ncbi:hypothetical protein [Aestuariivivens sediminis]|uniref:hypothetical protein n=1 Tax=Aestuariivivens sediminis TaxID=2913557 RepID=UPI001F5AB7C6|nr:hypothetical protein [Aestuariivivens sediminis]
MVIAEQKLLKWGLVLNAIYVLLFFLIRPDGINIVKISITTLLLFSVLIICSLSIKNIYRLKEIPQFSRFLFYMLLIWGGITIVRSFSFSIQDWVTNFGNVYMGLAWIAPLAMVLGLKLENWNIVFKVIFFVFKLMIPVFGISLLFNTSYLQWAWLLRSVNLILLLGLSRISLIKKGIVLVIIGIYILVAISVKQRMDLLFLSLTMGFLIMDKLIGIKIRRVFLKYIISFFILVLILVFTVGYEFVSNTISSIIDFQDSRTFLFYELFNELNLIEKWIGRGSLGTYYSHFFEHTKWYTINILKKPWWGDSSVRITIEVGYLQMILKGGMLLFLLNTLIYINAIYLALFKSSNKFVKRLGYYILVITLLSLVSLRPTFAPTFIFLWMAIGTVLPKKYRLMKDDEIYSVVKQLR